jgi:hypothetical protein
MSAGLGREDIRVLLDAALAEDTVLYNLSV